MSGAARAEGESGEAAFGPQGDVLRNGKVILTEWVYSVQWAGVRRYNGTLVKLSKSVVQGDIQFMANKLLNMSILIKLSQREI